MAARIASCPNCGAEITFRWSGAIQTTCAACRSILVRHDLDLTKVGETGDVPPSTSRIQLGTTGRHDGKPFEVIGRIIYHYERGHWSEWHIRLSGSDSAWLSDALGDYVVTKLVTTDSDVPDSIAVKPGQALTVGKTKFRISSITRAHYAGVEGELPFEYWDKSECVFADLVSEGDDVGTLDYSDSPPLLFVGRAVGFEALQLNNLREETVDPDERIRAAGLNCPQCGSAVELRTGALAQVVACKSCGSILDATDPNLQVLQQADARQTRRGRPAIPLGSTGKLKGQTWTVIGYQVRSIFVEQVEYSWREYLLWNVDQGFRYLTEYDGHWNEVSTLKGSPTQVSAGDQPVVEYHGTRFKHFQTADAITQLVLGEFPWQVRSGDRTHGEDYIAPPLMLSKEVTPDEVTWSLGTYTEPERIREAFKVKQEFPPRTGIFANQPNPRPPSTAYWGSYGLLILACIALIVLRYVTASNKEVFASTYEYNRMQGDTNAFVTPEFDVPGRASSLAFDISTNLDNNWAFFNLALIGADGTAYDFAREVSYYHGVEGGESWTEGSRSDRVKLPAIPPGKYYLRVEPERDPGGAPFTYGIKARRDVPGLWPYFAALLLLLVPPVVLTFSRVAFESARWKESDHAPESSDDE